MAKHGNWFHRSVRTSGIYILAVSALVGLSATFSPIKAATDFPRNTGYVTDTTHSLNSSQTALMSSMSEELEAKSGVQFATVIVDTLQGMTIEEYANKLFEKWGIGKKKDDKGLLMVVALKDKKVRIEVGYGLEPILTDAQAGDLLDDYVLPYFRQDDIQTGLSYGHVAIAQWVAKKSGVKLTGQHHQYDSGNGSILGLVILIFALFLIFSGGRMGWLPWLLIGSALGGGGSRDRFGGFGGSGFGGFGGGMSGGGGASRGW